ncbi:hypothetical protein [Candidatus Berkiella aquae]|uniref:Uncharacterized protein n=1 Tax=Candidatus Berkiella aquae TaxID=295108 RepID=A0A0Q9YUT6_9GAMM|nr:hypothetical protein [Candidatus Berkiella aquae]MCS5711091.1 hypothetical protein [Candidatus Berkiella aquae]
MYIPKNDRLKQLKDYLDPIGNDKKPTNLLSNSLSNFEHIIDTFKTLFNDQELDREDQLVVAWLYMAVTFSIHQWAADPQIIQDTNIGEKLKRIQALDAKIYPALGNILNNIKRIHLDTYTSFDRHYHQKLLQIQSNLFAYIKMLQSSGHDIKEITKVIPLSFDKDNIRISQNKAKHRPAAPTSDSELTTNLKLLRNLAPEPEQFQPIKQRADHPYIDEKTGCELDFPLRGENITIETDGIHHFYPETKIHTITHNFTASTLHERGWSRIPVLCEQVEFLPEHIAKMLQYEAVGDFSEKMKQLNKLQEAIQAEIRYVQEKLTSSFELPADKKPLYLEYLESLINKEHTLRTFLAKKHLEVFLRNPALSSDIDKLQHQINNTYVKLQPAEEELEKSNSQLLRINQAISAGEEQLKQSMAKSSAVVEKIEKFKKIEIALQEALNKYALSKTNGEYEKYPERHEKCFDDNTRKMRDVKKILRELESSEQAVAIKKLETKVKQDNAQHASLTRLKKMKEELVNTYKANIDRFRLSQNQSFAHYLPVECADAILNGVQSAFDVARAHFNESRKSVQRDNFDNVARSRNEERRQERQEDSRVQPQQSKAPSNNALYHKPSHSRESERRPFLPSLERSKEIHRSETTRSDDRQRDSYQRRNSTTTW